MQSKIKLSPEWQATMASVLLGVCIAVAISPKDSFFLGNFIIYWGPQAVILIFLSLASRNHSVVASTAVILALYLAAFNFWVTSHIRPDPLALAWLGYLFSLPGAAIGATFGAFLIAAGFIPRFISLAALSAFCTLLGLVLNQLVVCSTVMHCSV